MVRMSFLCSKYLTTTCVQDDCLSDTSLDRHSQVSQTSQTSISQTKAGWSLTITVTPTGLILATSIAVNVALAVMWLRQGVEGV